MTRPVSFIHRSLEAPSYLTRIRAPAHAPIYSCLCVYVCERWTGALRPSISPSASEKSPALSTSVAFPTDTSRRLLSTISFIASSGRDWKYFKCFELISYSDSVEICVGETQRNDVFCFWCDNLLKSTLIFSQLSQLLPLEKLSSQYLFKICWWNLRENWCQVMLVEKKSLAAP
ncbi:hypothetical protein LSTR_LSTR000792 [Laodelphax striatellus]|uniref:Uncharacterized protein n=1 Tax=Laodelphax striatellus TaxID=195883 RepID=A0A482XH23_LAOST|nr:hypothetical protein LSTR_LSTR000792 [Laodelphax striatellus]